MNSYRSARGNGCSWAAPFWRFLFEQEFEQWCDCNLTDRQLAEIRSIPLVRLPNSHLHDFVALANAFE